VPKRLWDGTSIATDARLSGRGGGDPKGVSAGGGNSKPTLLSSTICESDRTEDLLSVPSEQKRDSGDSLFRLDAGPEVSLLQRFVPGEPSFFRSLYRQLRRKRNWFRFFEASKSPPGLCFVDFGRVRLLV
jgi:hypothetical protein